jgi:hypothetical protein
MQQYSELTVQAEANCIENKQVSGKATQAFWGGQMEIRKGNDTTSTRTFISQKQ